MRGRRISVLAAIVALLGGCRSCKNDHPYVPAAANSGGSGGTFDASTTSHTTSADGGAESSLALPPGTMGWKEEGLDIQGGAQEIALVLARDFDGDGKKDALAILRPPLAERKPGSRAGQLVFVHGGEPNRPPTALATGPALGQWPACVATARLEKVGPRSAFAEIGSACPKAIGSRAVAVVRLGRPAPVVSFDAVLHDPRDAPTLGIDVQVADRDNDGVDDTVLHLTLDGSGGAPPLDAKLAFFDRPAGPSRDPEEPEASLKAVAARISSKTTKTKEMPALVDQMRALYRAICEEGGAPRITQIHGGSATSCGSSKALEDAGIANIRALASAGDVLGAFFAADLAQAAPATKTASRSFEIEKYLALAAPVEDAKAVRTLATRVDAPLDAQPQWGPLAFDRAGRLLVRSGKTVTSVDPDSGEERAESGPAWSSEILSPDGKRRWFEAYQACEGTAFRANFAVLETDGMIEASLPFAPRLGRGCTGHGDPVLAQPIAWGPRGLEAIVAARPVIIKDEGPGEMRGGVLEPFLDERAPQGSPRASSGKMALAIPNGLLVRAEGKWTNLRAPDFKANELRSCTIGDAGTHVACVRRGKVLVIQR